MASSISAIQSSSIVLFTTDNTLICIVAAPVLFKNLAIHPMFNVFHVIAPYLYCSKVRGLFVCGYGTLCEFSLRRNSVLI